MRSRGQMAAVQQEKLEKYLYLNKETAFGRDHGFGRLKNYGDYCSAVPIIEDFESISPYIDAIASGKQKVLTHDPVICFESTSGSSGAAKWIPYTDTLKSEFQNALAVWMHETAIAYPKAFHGTAYWSISPPMKKREITEGGLLVGTESDTDYLQGWVGKLLFHAFAVNHRINADTAHHFYLQLSRQLLASSRLSFISVWSPNYFLQLHDFMVKHWEEILDVKTFTDKRKRELMDLDHFVWNKAFPGLQLLSCWTAAQSGIWLPEVKQHLGNVPIQPKGLLSTEGVVSVPLRDNTHALAYTAHFFEFRHVDSREVYLAHQLDPGETFEVIITTGGGLCRYNTRDKVRIVGHQEGVPLIEFLGKGQEVSDLVGEKVSASCICPLFNELVEASEGTIKSLFLYPVLQQQKVGYQILVETNLALDTDALAKKVERKLLENPYYQQGLATGQLLPLKAVPKAIGFRKEAFERYRQKKGIKDGDIKLPLILPLGFLEDNPTIVHG